ncbi:MAG: TonB-dependent receptor [Candidatus Electrothrix scaldis]|nr:MAG: TonB-dependent receptor [Candidatus Electrothrix sp. GW3-3]
MHHAPFRKKIFSTLALTATVLPHTVLPHSVQAASSPDNDQVILMDEITVKGEAITPADQPGTVNMVDMDEIQEVKLSQPEEILEEIPGIEIHRYGMGGVANEFAIRGFQNAGHGGDAAIAVDGILLNEGESHADGYADMNVIIPLELDRVEVFKGPSSPLFGNFARGGAISFHTRKSGEYNTVQTTAGSYESYDFQHVFGHALSDSLQLNTALQYSSTGGYQDNSSWLRGNFSGRLGWQATPELDAAFSVRVHASEWDAPGYIPKYQFDDEEAARHQAVNAEDDGGDKAFTTERLDLGYNLSGDRRVLAWAYSTQQDFTRFAKFGYDPGGQTERFYDRMVYGTGTSYNFSESIADRELKGVAGIEYLHEATEWARYNTENRVRSEQTQDRDFTINTLSLFGQADYDLHPLFKPWLGLRYDTFSGDYENNDPGSTPSTSDMNDYDHLSPKIGFLSSLHETLDFRASYTQGFALPSDVLKYNSAAGDTATTVHQYETGFLFEPSDLLTADLALFLIDTEDEIQEYPSGSGIYVNLGETRREGLELSATLRPGIPGFELFGDITLINTEITSNPDPAMVGKEVTGVPEYTTNLGLRYHAASGFSGRMKWRHVDSYYIDGANTISYEGYDVTDASLGYGGITENGTGWQVNLDVDNLFDEHYSQAAWSGYDTINYAVSPGQAFWLRFTLDM